MGVELYDARGREPHQPFFRSYDKFNFNPYKYTIQFFRNDHIGMYNHYKEKLPKFVRNLI